MKNSQLSRFEIEKIANRLLPEMLYKEKNNSIEFDFESLGTRYEVEYGRDRFGHWVLFKYVPKAIAVLE
jgi:hypothetical protein